MTADSSSSSNSSLILILSRLPPFCSILLFTSGPSPPQAPRSRPVCIPAPVESTFCTIPARHHLPSHFKWRTANVMRTLATYVTAELVATEHSIMTRNTTQLTLSPFGALSICYDNAICPQLFEALLIHSRAACRREYQMQAGFSLFQIT